MKLDFCVRMEVDKKVYVNLPPEYLLKLMTVLWISPWWKNAVLSFTAMQCTTSLCFPGCDLILMWQFS